MPRSGHLGESAASGTRVTALLGPTNTGKTHCAIERMLDHPTGIIGLPLRLLAREVYDRVTARLGESEVALVTGEEKRVPPRARYWICTVEAMPAPERLPDGGASFVAVDEIQLAGHPERGHVFTDRLLHARGRDETYFMGAATMRPLLRRLVPDAHLESRPRLSSLRGAGSVSLAALPPRSAVVAFSATRVYEIAERLRGRRGGAAIVFGALSPRVRNAQVAMYEAGEVDYLVATDAVGMGLNLDVGCVAFAELQKFDGLRRRELDDAELAQIAGRAGRNAEDGRFATLEPLPPLAARTVRAIENHRFDPQERIYWRAHELDFSSVPSLRRCLRARPPTTTSPELVAAPDAEDLRALEHLAGRPELVARASGREAVELLWQVCQIPDFRAIKVDDHFHLQEALFLQLTGHSRRLDADWVARHVEALRDPNGDLDTLLGRMAAIRTWTYVSGHARWLREAAHWQARTRAIEDSLSDALHDKLVQKFVNRKARGRSRTEVRSPPAAGAHPPARDREAAVGVAPLPRQAPARHRTSGSAPPSFAELLRAHFEPGGDVAATPAPLADAADESWVNRCLSGTHAHFRLRAENRIVADGEVAGRLVRGVDLLHPEVVVATARPLSPGARLRLGRRLQAWTRDLVTELVGPLRDAQRRPNVSPAVRGLLYQLEVNLGTVASRDARPQLADLDEAGRADLESLGVRLDSSVVFVPALLNPLALGARAALVNASLAGGSTPARIEVPRPGTPSIRIDAEVPRAAYACIGYPAFGARGVRADLVRALRAVAREGTRGARPLELARRLGCSRAELESIRAELLGDGDRVGWNGNRGDPGDDEGGEPANPGRAVGWP